ncbi:MAG: hypothetical protein LBI87_15205, partial [Candidatus Accumulibacter sp.]|nr:hypothetical protein [Accumulibacter sp.]
MTGKRNGANVEESPPSIPVYQGNDEKTMRANKSSLNQTPANSRHSRESGNPVRDLRPEGPRISDGARAPRPHRSLFGQDARAPVEMRRYAPEYTRWIPAFAGMTGKRNGASARESPSTIPVYQGNDEKTMRANKASLNQTPANSRHSRESGNPVRCLRP